MTKQLKGEEGEKVQEYITEKRDTIVGEENDKRAEAEKPELTEKEIQAIEAGIRLPDKFLWKGFKARLYENGCQNRGFVLDGYPRNYKDCIKIFTRRKKIEGDDEEEQPESEEEEEGEGGDDDMGPNIKDPIAREIDDLITPNHII